MQVRRYVEADFEQVRSWLEARNMKVFHPAILPSTGFIIDNNAVVFLYKTDSDLCYLENLITNPSSDSAARDKAINLIIEAAFNEANRLGFKFVMSVTDVPAVIARALSLNAHIETNKVLLTKQLS